MVLGPVSARPAVVRFAISGFPGGAGDRVRRRVRQNAHDGQTPVPHHYRFQVFAIDKAISREVTTPRALLATMSGHVLGRGLMTGTYER